MNNRNRPVTQPAVPDVSKMPIQYDEALERNYSGWAKDCRWDPERLRQATQSALRSHHQNAFVDHPSHLAVGKQPNIFSLTIASIEVIFTVEGNQVIVRGYGWDTNVDPGDEDDGGGCYLPAVW